MTLPYEKRGALTILSYSVVKNPSTSLDILKLLLQDPDGAVSGRRPNCLWALNEIIDRSDRSHEHRGMKAKALGSAHFTNLVCFHAETRVKNLRSALLTVRWSDCIKRLDATFTKMREILKLCLARFQHNPLYMLEA